MKIVVESPEIERSEVVEEQGFRIEANAVAFKTLRGSIYPNPIRTICREIPSNARDAHREVGKSDLAIDIQLPNDLDPTFSVRDYGPGINPDRIKDTFIVFFASTKRQDNKQTGGFGLGAKSPLGYSDSFNIETITPNENGEMVKRCYCAYIDESERGSLATLSEEVTTEPQGTKISIPIKSCDFYKFENEVLDALYYWNPKPNIIGEKKDIWDRNTDKYTDFTGVGKHCIWEMNVNTEHLKSKVILDGISYELKHEEIVEDWDALDENFRNFIEKSSFKLIFDCGALSVIANRDSLQYNLHTRTKLYETIKEIYDYISTHVTAALDAAPDYVSALKMYRDLRRGSVEFLMKSDFNWKGEPLLNFVNMDADITEYYKKEYPPYNLKKDNSNGVGTNTEKVAIVIYDEVRKIENPVLNRNKVLYLLEDCNFKKVYFISEFDSENEKEEFLKLHPNLYALFMKSSEVPKKKHDRAERSKMGKGRFRYYTGSTRSYNAAFSKVTVEAGKEMIYLKVEGRNCELFGKLLELHDLCKISSGLATRIYGLTENEIKKHGDTYKMIRLEDHLQAFADSQPKSISVTSSMADRYGKLYNAIKSKQIKIECPLIQDYYDQSKIATKKEDSQAARVAEMFDLSIVSSNITRVVNSTDLTSLCKEFGDKYPLAKEHLKSHSYYSFSSDEEIIAEWEWYFKNKK